MAKTGTERTTAWRARRKVKLGGLIERFERGGILRVCPVDIWGIQEIKLILDPDAQEAGGALAEMFNMDVHEFMEMQLSLNMNKLGKAKAQARGDIERESQ